MSNSLSANTFFHFTPEKNNLINILKHGLYIRYSLEYFGNIIKDRNELLLPMVCFCDIPLSKTQTHSKKYGSYAIGLSQEWGVKKGLSPVIYATNNSETANILDQLSSDLGTIFDINDNDTNQQYLTPNIDLQNLTKLDEEKQKIVLSQTEKVFEVTSQLGHFLKYIKPYKGKGHSNGKTFNNIKFYDEREWRFVPPKNLLKEVEIKDSYSKEFYMDPIKKRCINMKLASHIKLNFQPNEVKFIIVKEENEIPNIIKEIRDIYEDRATYNEIMLLTSRIISMEQIINDL